MGLTRPTPGVPLLGPPRSSLDIIDPLMDLAEANEGALALRTSPAIVSTDSFTDVPEVILNDCEVTTGWGASNATVAVSAAPPATVGTNSIHVGLSAHGSDHSLVFLNLTSVGYASGLTVAPGQYITFDLQCTFTTGGGLPPFSAFIPTLASGTGLSGTLATRPFSVNDDAVMLVGLWYRVLVPVGSMTNVKSLGLDKPSGGSGASGTSATFLIDNVRVTGRTPLDQALASQSSVVVMVPPSYSTTVTQSRLSPSALKAIADFRPDHAWISGFGGVKHIREGAIDETGATDMTDSLQTLCTTLVGGDTLALPPKANVRLDGGILLFGTGVTLDGQGASLFQTSLISSGGYAGNPNAVLIPDGPQQTIKNLKIFGSKSETKNGSILRTVAGTPTVSGTSMILDAQNEEVAHPYISGTTPPAYARDYLGRNRFDWVLSDNNHVPNDCVLQIKADGDTGAVLATSTVTLTSTPTTYTIYATPTNLRSRLVGSVKKNLPAANTITVTSQTNYGRNYTGAYGPLEFNHAIQMAQNDLRLQDLWLEGISGDGIFEGNGSVATGLQGLRVRRVTVRANGRQSISICGGSFHRIKDFTSILSARHGVDIEPVGPPMAVEDVVFQDLEVWGSSEASWSSNAPAYVRNINVHGFRGGTITGGVLHSIWTDIDMSNIRTPAGYNWDTNPGITIGGQDWIIDGLTTSTGILIDAGGTNDEFGVLQTNGAVTLRNVRFTELNQRVAVDVRCPGVHLENITFHKQNSTAIDPARSVGLINMLQDTTYHNIDPVHLRLSFPKSYPGIAQGDTWFPGGLDMLGEGLNNIRGLSGTSTQGTNLSGIGQVVAAGQTSATVVFPTRTYANLASVGVAAANGGTLSGLNYYRVAARPRKGGPVLPLAQVTAGLGSFTACTLTLTKLFDVAAGVAFDGFTIYAGTVNGGPYTRRFDIVPNTDFHFFGSAGPGTDPDQTRIAVTDLGATLIAAPGNWVWRGYSFPYAVQNGSWAPVDETGFEPDAAYAAFVVPSWPTTVAITAKRTNGFDMTFGSACPGGGGTLDWFLVR